MFLIIVFLSAQGIRTQLKDSSELRTSLRTCKIHRVRTTYHLAPLGLSGPYFSGFLHKWPNLKGQLH